MSSIFDDSFPLPLKVEYRRCDIDELGNPEVMACLNYWNEIRGDRFAPSWSEFDLLALPLSILPHVGVVDVRQDPFDLVYRYWGSAGASAHRMEMAGKSVLEMRPKEEAQSVFAQYADTYEAREPRLYIAELKRGDVGKPVHELSFRLPLSDDGETVHHVFAFSNMGPDFQAFLKDVWDQP